MEKLFARRYSPFPLTVFCLSLFVATIRAEDDRPAQDPLPASVSALLSAEGTLEAGHSLFSILADIDRKPMAERDAKARHYIERVYPACRALLAGSTEARAAVSLRDAFFTELATQIRSLPPDVPLAPVYPVQFAFLGSTNFPIYGALSLIDDDPMVWAVPALWDGRPQTPVFTGWTIEKDMMAFTKASTALVRSDFRLDDAEVTGDVRVDGGECVFVILRSDVVVKFQPGEVRGSGGNLNVKIGYDNLRTSTLFSKIPEIHTGRWYPFQIALSGLNLRIVFNGTEALSSVIARDARLGGSRLARAGYFGFGGNSAGGAFRNVRLKALTSAGQQALPRLRIPPRYHIDTTVRFLEGPTNNLVSLIHTQIESYQPSKHPIANGVLSLEGAPYVQLSRKDLTADHFKATGKVKFLAEGSVWFRANNTLVFGLRCKTGETPFAVKHSTGNFNSADEDNEGDSLQPNQVYLWELEYHEPVGLFRLNGRTAAISLATSDRDRDKTGPNQFGVSSYNSKAEITDVVVERLALGVSPPDSRAKQAHQYLDRGITDIDKALNGLKGSREPGAAAAVAILEGPGPAVTASLKDVIQVADGFRDARDWPTYLALLEANAQRFDEKTDARSEAEVVWNKAKAEFENATKSVGIGEIGMDNVVRIGDKIGEGFADADGKHVWLFIPTTKELVQYDPSEGTCIRKLALKIEPGNVVPRNGYFLCTESGHSVAEREAETPPVLDKEDADKQEAPPAENIQKVDFKTGEALASTNMPAAGGILQLAGHPKQDRTFVCVNENTKPSLVDFSLFRIYLLDETTMEIKDTGASGMFMAVDPMGRYLYAGFHIRWRPGIAVDTGYLHVLPRDGQIDHLVRYRITADGLAFDGERPAPGIGGHAIVADPSGNTVCYVGDLNSRDIKDKRTHPFGIQALKTVRWASTAGEYDAVSRPQIMEFNPVLAEVYVLTGDQIRRYDTATFEMKGTITLPPSVDKNHIVGLLAAPDGGSLLAAYAGKSAGVYISRLRPHQKIANNTPILPGTMDTAEDMIRTGKSDEAKPLLLDVVRRLSYTPTGDKAARLLLETEKSSLTDTATPLWQIPASDTADDSGYMTLDKLTVPAKGAESDSADTDPAYAGNGKFNDRLDELLSFGHLADEFPYSWLWQYRQADQEFPKSARLKIEVATRLLKAGRPDSASSLVREALDLAGRKGQLSFMAWQILDRIYEKRGDKRRQVAALAEAQALSPQDPYTLMRLGSLYGTLNCFKKAQNSKLLSWYIFPSQPGLVKELSEAGILGAKPLPEMDAAAIFKQAVPAVVLISHERGNGTGFILGRNGLLLTNHHVVDGAEGLTVKIKTPDGAEHSVPARVVASDVLRDVALLSLRGEVPAITPLVLVNSDSVEPGEKVVAIGNPGIGTRVLMHTTTEGIISGRNRVMGGKAFFQISAAVNPGNSGGPLFNKYGQVIGMVTLKADLENVGFAVPATELLNFLEEQKAP